MYIYIYIMDTMDSDYNLVAMHRLANYDGWHCV